MVDVLISAANMRAIATRDAAIGRSLPRQFANRVRAVQSLQAADFTSLSLCVICSVTAII